MWHKLMIIDGLLARLCYLSQRAESVKLFRSPRIISNTFKTQRLKLNYPIIAGFQCSIPSFLLSGNVDQQVRPQDGQTDASVFLIGNK